MKREIVWRDKQKFVKLPDKMTLLPRLRSIRYPTHSLVPSDGSRLEQHCKEGCSNFEQHPRHKGER